MTAEHSKKAYAHSDKLSTLHNKMLNHVESIHGEALGELSAAHEQHRTAAKSAGKGTKVHHHVASIKSGDIYRLALRVQKSSIALAKLAGEMKDAAYTTAKSHETAKEKSLR